MSTQASRIKTLETQIRKHNKLYYDQDSPEISDVEYDKLKDELRSLAPESPVLEEIGNPTYGQKEKHSSQMGSLTKCHTVNEVIEKFSGDLVVVMPKIDGCSMALRYKGGNLVMALTRGKGLEGEVVTPNASQISNLPKTIPFKGDIEIRGEVYIAKKDFYGIMDQPGYAGKPDGFANPRNAASGSLRQKDAKLSAERKLRFVSYKALPYPNMSQYGVLQFLNEQGFEACPRHMLTLIGNPAEDLQTIIDQIKATDLPYDIDGAVIMISNLAKFDQLGWTGKCPNGALAYKYETDRKTSRVTGIEWNTSRTGRVVPVALIEPTQIAGSEVSRCTLNNLKWMEATDVGVGDLILFEKANEIIPKVIDVVERTKNRQRQIPDTCPTCGDPLAKKGVDLVCESESCPAQFVKLVRHILTCLDVQGIAEATLEKMADAGILTKPQDIFEITVEKLTEAGFGDVEAEKMVKSVASLEASPARILKALGIRLWGETIWNNLFDVSQFTPEQWLEPSFPTDKYLDACKMGPGRGEALKEGFLRRKDLLIALTSYVRIKKAVAGSLGGKSFCITGTLSKGRKEIQEAIRQAGGVVKDSVSAGLDYLVAGADCGSKLAKAEKLGVKILSESDLDKLISG